MPPEWFTKDCCSPLPTLTWSIGLLSYFLFNGEDPFHSKLDVLEYSPEYLEFSEQVDEATKQFIRDLLTLEEKRMKLIAVFFHPFMDQ